MSTNYKFISTDPNLLKMSVEMFSRTLYGSNPTIFFIIIIGISDYVLMLGFFLPYMHSLCSL